MATAPTTTFDFDSRTTRARAASRLAPRLEFAAALAIVIALHAALALWVLHARERPIPPREPPRTIVARLLRVAPAPAPAATHDVAAAPPVLAPRPRAAPPARAKAPPAPRPPAPPRPARREAPPRAQPSLPAPAPAPAPAPPAAATPAGPPPQAAPPAAQAATGTPSQAAAPQAAASAPPKDVSHVDCNIAQPDYPELSRRRNETGTAVVRFVVGVDGRVDSAKIQHSSGYARLDAAALDAVRSGTCRPWKEAGIAVRVAYAQPFVFGLGN